MISEHEKTTRDKFNHLKKYYDETWDETSHTLHVGLFENESDSLDDAYKQATNYLIKNISSFVPINKKSLILDVGCGTGRTLVEICLEYGCRGIGVDLSDEQIKDAKAYLQKINNDQSQKGLSKIRVKFIRASGSNLEKSIKKEGQFTHIISQDAIFLITNKQSFFDNIYRLLAPGGIFAVADFLSESPAGEMTNTEQNLIYKLVNWSEGLSFNAYQEILKKIGLSLVKTERHDEDMIRTYEKLAQKMDQYISQGDKTYLELKERYGSIASAVKNKKMSWGFFFAKKPSRKVALLAGTKEKSIGRFLAKNLHTMGWEIWLYSRNAQKVNKLYWHERKCDISNEKSISKLMDEIQDLDLVMMLADTGDGHGSLEELSENGVKGFIDAKLVGSVLLNKFLALKFFNRNKPIKIIWCAGKPSKKPKHLILYSMVNSGLAYYIDELNDHYKNIFEAYYLPTNLISPSTLGDEYIQKVGLESVHIAEHPQAIMDKVKQILDGEVDPGMIDTTSKIL